MEHDVTVTLTVRVSGMTAAEAQSWVGDQLRATFFDGQDVGAISAMDTVRVR